MAEERARRRQILKEKRERGEIPEFLCPTRRALWLFRSRIYKYVSYDAGIIRLHLTGRRVFTVDMSLDEMERQFDPDPRNHIVDVGSIERLTTWFSRKTKIVVSGWPEAEIYVIKERAPMLRR